MADRPPTTMSKGPEKMATAKPTAAPRRVEGFTIGPETPQDVRDLFARRLAGQALNGAWLPEGRFPELDELRDEHHRLLTAVTDARARMGALGEEFNDADRAHEAALREAVRRGEPMPVDKRPTESDREAGFAPLREQVWATLRVLADHVERVHSVVREHEDQWLADLQNEVGALAEQRRKAARILAEAHAAEWHVDRMGRWLLATADESGLAGPAPTGREAAPAAWNFDPRTLERHWSKLRPWNQQRSPEDDDQQVEWDARPGIERKVAADAAFAVLPLDEADRFKGRAA